MQNIRYIIDNENHISWIGKYTYGCSVWDGIRLAFRKSVNFNELPDYYEKYVYDIWNEFSCNLDELLITKTINGYFHNDSYTSHYDYCNGIIDFDDDIIYFYNSDTIDHIIECELSIIYDLIIKHNVHTHVFQYNQNKY